MKTIEYIRWTDPPVWQATLANSLPLWMLSFALLPSPPGLLWQVSRPSHTPSAILQLPGNISKDAGYQGKRPKIDAILEIEPI